MKLTALIKKPKRIFYGWWVILIGAVIHGIGAGFHFYGFTTLFLPISSELQLSRTVTSAVFSMARVEGALEGPLIGWLIDRLGSKKLVIFGLLLFSIGFIAMRWMNSLLMFFILFSGVISIGYQTGFTHATWALANKWFRRQSSRATGIISATAGIGGAALVPVLAWLVTQYGWRTAVVIIGVSTLLIGLPLSLVIRSTPEEKGLRPDGDETITGEMAAKSEQAVEEASFTVKEALKTVNFWILCLALLLRQFIVGGIWVHLSPLLVSKSFDAQSAANAVGILLTISIPVRFGFGWLGDLYSKRYLMAICSFIGATSLGVLLIAQSLWQVYLFVFLFALSYGVSPLNVSIVGEYFGRKYFATIRGILALLYAVGIVAGPIYAGYIYDTTQSYQIAFFTFMAIYALSAMVFVFAKRPKAPFRVNIAVAS